MQKIVFLVLVVMLLAGPALGGQVDGWIGTGDCFVAATPDEDAAVIGVLRYQAAVTVEVLQNGWAQIIHAPVRDLRLEDTWLDCSETGCFIKMRHLSTSPPE